ncbi:MAG: hypothetical protein QM820_01185 [Minicystis sp.]
MNPLYILGIIVALVVLYLLFARKQPRAMRVQFVLLEHDKPIIKDTIVLGLVGETKTYEVAGGVYTLSYSLDTPMSPIEIVAPTYKGVTLVGVHESKDWEAIAIGRDAVLRYKCTPLTAAANGAAARRG